MTVPQRPLTFDPDDPLAPMIDAETSEVVERIRAHQALRDYAHLGSQRSLPKLHKQYTAVTPDADVQPPTRSIDTLKSWSRRFEWQKRIAVWDLQEADREALEWEQRRKLVRERDWQAGEDLREKLNAFLDALPRFITSNVAETPSEGPNGEQIITKVITVGLNTTLTQLAHGYDIASKLQRLATNEPTENIRYSGAALDALIERELQALASSKTTPRSE